MKQVKSALLGTALLLSLALTACETGPIKPTYVSPVKYQSFDCTQLLGEYKRLTQVMQTGVETPSTIFKNVGVGIAGAIGRGGGLYPTIQVGMGQSSSQSSERMVLAQMLGERDAIVEAARYKHCPFLLPDTPAQTTTVKP